MEINKALITLKKLKKNEYIIFLFHGVVKYNKYQVRNYTKKHITQKNFFNFLIKCKKIGNPISINDLHNYTKKKIKLPERSFLVSFDDGFENNYSCAIPILKKLKVPSIFYFSSDFIENNTMSWIDRVEYCFENYNGNLKLPWRKEKCSLNSNQKKIKYLNEIRKIVKNNKNIDVDLFTQNIFFQTNIKPVKSQKSSIDQKISWSKVKKINKSSLFTIGGHSHQHISLGLIDEKRMKKQINKSFEMFKKKANLKLNHYSYPEGQKIDFNSKVIKTLKKKKY